MNRPFEKRLHYHGPCKDCGFSTSRLASEAVIMSSSNKFKTAKHIRWTVPDLQPGLRATLATCCIWARSRATVLVTERGRGECMPGDFLLRVLALMISKPLFSLHGKRVRDQIKNACLIICIWKGRITNVFKKGATSWNLFPPTSPTDSLLMLPH